MNFLKRVLNGSEKISTWKVPIIISILLYPIGQKIVDDFFHEHPFNLYTSLKSGLSNLFTWVIYPVQLPLWALVAILISIWQFRNWVTKLKAKFSIKEPEYHKFNSMIIDNIKYSWLWRWDEDKNSSFTSFNIECIDDNTIMVDEGLQWRCPRCDKRYPVNRVKSRGDIYRIVLSKIDDKTYLDELPVK